MTISAGWRRRVFALDWRKWRVPERNVKVIYRSMKR